MLNPVLLALIAGCFTWLITACGAAVVYAASAITKKHEEALLGFSCGVMLAASFWSLLLPAVELASGPLKFLPATAGFLCGGCFIHLVHKHMALPKSLSKFGDGKKAGSAALLVTAITLHNIPEGLAIGFAFGSAGGSAGAALSAAVLALSIGLQNLPEGAAVSLPLYSAGLSRNKSFFYGQISGAVEPLAAVFGALLAVKIGFLLPYALAFAAGAMIFVAVDELIPQAHACSENSVATFGILLGFVLMTALDVLFK